MTFVIYNLDKLDFFTINSDLIVIYLFLFFSFFQGMTTLGNSFFFLASRLGDSILVQYCSGASNSNMQIDEVNTSYLLYVSTSSAMAI